MDLLHYIRLARKWAWLLVLIIFVAASFAYVTTISAPPLYNATSTISIGNYLDVQNPTDRDIATGIALAETYAQILRTPNLHRAVIEELGLTMDQTELNESFSTEIIQNTSLLKISVTYMDPIQATDIANELARQLILQSPTNLTEEQRLQITSLNERITAQSTDLQNLRDLLATVEDELRNSPNLDQDARTALQTERTTLVDQINEANANIATYTNTLATIQQRTNSIEIVQEALVPTEPLGRGLVGRVILTVIIALVITFSILLALDFVRDTFENTDDVSQTLNLPVLGVISRFKKSNASYQDRLITELPQLSQIPEEYRMLRTNLLYALQDKSVIVISSSLPEEGKTVSAANLALSIAQAGLRVVLVDADLRRPRLHEPFDLSNDFGLTNLLSNQSRSVNGGDAPQEQRRDKVRVPNLEDWRQAAQPTPHENLSVISSGFIPLNPTEILGSIMMRRWTDAILNSGADFVIFDTSPILVASDAAVLASRLGAAVMLVIQANKTRKGSVIEAIQRFDAVDVDVSGILLNRADPRMQSYYGYSYTYYYRNN